MKYFLLDSPSCMMFIGLVFTMYLTRAHALGLSSSQTEIHEREAEPSRRSKMFQYHQHKLQHSSWLHQDRPKLLINLGPNESTKAPAFPDAFFDTSLFCINDSTWRYDNKIGSDGLKRDCDHISLIDTGASMLDLDVNICERVGSIEHDGKTVYDACCACGGGLRVGRDEPSEFLVIDEESSSLVANPNTNPSLAPSQNAMEYVLSRPSSHPSLKPLIKATIQPSQSPTLKPSWSPSVLPTQSPTATPTNVPSKQRSLSPTRHPTFLQSTSPTMDRSSRTPSKPPSMPPTSEPSFIHTESLSSKPTFDLDVCGSYSTRWIIDLGRSCDSDLNGCECTDASHRIANGEIDCNTAVCPDRCSVCDYCLETVMSCIGPTSSPTPRPSEIPTFEPPSSAPTSCVDDPDWIYEEDKAQDGLRRDCRHVSLIQRVMTGHTFDICRTLGHIVYKQKTVDAACCACGGSIFHTTMPSYFPSSSSSPTLGPSVQPSQTQYPSSNPSESHTSYSSLSPSQIPSTRPTTFPSKRPTATPSSIPSNEPMAIPTKQPSIYPSLIPSEGPTEIPSEHPSFHLSLDPTSVPTAFPSSHPSSFPTPHPTSRPSSLPSLTKSTKPTNTPSTLPSIDFCAGDNDGKYGNTTGNFLIVDYDYTFEYNQTLISSSGETVLNMVTMVEKGLTGFLLEYFFEECASYKKNQQELTSSDGRMLHRHSEFDSLSPKELDTITGISFLPVDLITGESCVESDSDSLCTIVKGRMILYLTKLNELDLFTELAHFAIKKVLGEDRLESIHEAILSLTYIENGEMPGIQHDRNDTNIEDDDDPESSAFPWILVGGGLGTFLVGATTFRYVSVRAASFERYAVMDLDRNGSNGELVGDRISLEDEISDLDSLTVGRSLGIIHENETGTTITESQITGTDLESNQGNVEDATDTTIPIDVPEQGVSVTILFPESNDDINWNTHEDESESVEVTTL